LFVTLIYSLIPRSLLRDFTRWGIPKGEKCEFSPFGCECKLGLHSQNHIGKYPVACYGVFDFKQQGEPYNGH